MRSVSLRYRLAYVAMVLLVSSHFALAYLTGTKSYVNIIAYVQGEAPLPYQYRALAAWILHGIAVLPIFRAAAHMAPAPFSQPEILAWLLLACLSMALMIEITRRAIKVFVDDEALSGILAFATPAALYMSFVALASTYRFSYPYDLLSVALFSLAILLLLQNRLGWFYALFPVVTLARETSIFLIPLLLCLRWDGRARVLRRDSAHALALLAIWLGVKLWLQIHYGANPRDTTTSGPLTGMGIGGDFLLQLWPNLLNLMNPLYWPGMLSALGWLWVVVLIGWRYIDSAAIKRALVILPALYFLAIMLVGRITEVRLFGELTLLFAVATAIIVRNLLMARGYRPIP